MSMDGAQSPAWQGSVHPSDLCIAGHCSDPDGLGQNVDNVRPREEERSVSASEKAISQALKILVKALPAVFEDLCPRCSSIFAIRLSGITSGLELAEIIRENCNPENTHEPVPNDEDASIQDGSAYSESDVEEVSEPNAKSYTEASLPDDSVYSETQSESVDTEMKFANGKSLSPQERERLRFLQVVRKRDFTLIERVNRRLVNVLQGLELHTNVFSNAEQSRLLDFIFDLERKGRNNELKGRTFSASGGSRGRIRIQFGCCYNYMMDKDDNPPGIIKGEEVEPLPPLIKAAIKRLIRWHVLPPDCVPDSCIINIYNEGSYIPPHIDHHDFLRPFCTISLLSECNILFGYQIKSPGPGKFQAPFSLPLPVGSVLVLNGKGANKAKHCVPPVPTNRVSITLRKMDPRKVPYGFKRDPSLDLCRPISV